MENAERFWKKTVETSGSFHGRHGNFQRILGRIVFLIMVIRKELRISINRRATPSKVDSFSIQEFSPLSPRTSYLFP